MLTGMLARFHVAVNIPFLGPRAMSFTVRADLLGRGGDEALLSEKKKGFSLKGGGNSVNEGFGKDSTGKALQ